MLRNVDGNVCGRVDVDSGDGPGEYEMETEFSSGVRRP